MEHVVTVSPDQAHLLEESLASVRAQQHRRRQERVLRWGPEAGADAPDIGAARALALRTTQAPMLRLIEAGDTVPAGSTTELVAALQGTGAASAAGVSLPLPHAWRDEAYAVPGSEPGLADRVLDVGACRRLGLDLGASSGRFADPVVAQLESQSRTVHTDAVVHHDHGRATGLPFGHQRRWAAEADAWIASVTAGLDAGAHRAWAGAVVDRRLRALLSDAESLSAAQWDTLVGLCRRLEELVGPETARVESRILLGLVARDRREVLTGVVTARWRAPHDLPTEVADGQVRALLAADALPTVVRRLGERETPLVLRLQSCSAQDVEVVGFVRGVETRTVPGVAVLADGRELAVESAATPTATKVAGEAEHNHDHAWLRIQRPPGEAAATWHVRMTSQGVTREALLHVPAGTRPRPVSRDPRGDDEIGPWAQQQLQRWYAGEHRIEPDLAYFQSYTGQQATDSPLAIHRALRRARPDIRVRWLVEDPAVDVPEGAEPVLLRSREWYRTLATAHWLVTNIEMDLWFRRKPGQELLQTFHGNPSKQMGLAAWRASGLTSGQVERSLDHGPRNWTMLVSPSPEMTSHYREQFRYHGPVVDHGYPRDDDLVGPQATQIRERARRDLGIEAGQKAVLYAPTWRDEKARNYRRADLHDGFDVRAAARGLGEDHVLLLRGHRFHRDLAMSGARVLDVTDHAQVNDLILAADAAVLDYSSIRFDFALTGRPMVFCVPDLADYTGGRGFLFDFTETAPGPLVRDTAEVVAALADLDALRAEYADAMAAFNARFNAHQDGHAADRVVEAFFGD